MHMGVTESMYVDKACTIHAHVQSGHMQTHVCPVCAHTHWVELIADLYRS